MQPRTVLIPLFDGVQSLDVTGPLEVFAAAGDHAVASGQGDPGYRVITASLGGGPVRCDSGLRLLPAENLRLLSGTSVDTLVVPGGPSVTLAPPELIEWLRR